MKERTKIINQSGLLFFWLILIAAIFFVVLTVSYASKITSQNSLLKPTLQVKVATESGFVNPVQNEEARKNEEKALKKAEQIKYINANGPCKFIPILMYHHVADPPKNWLYVDTKTFASQLDYLQQKGYTTVSLPEIVAGLNSGNLPAKPVVLTFDDGYRDVFTGAFPALADRGMKATFFLVTQLMEGADYLTWEQAREIAHKGLFTIGDHTLSHAALAGLSEEKVRDQILSAKNILQAQLGITVNVFAFPYGSLNSLAAKILQEGNFVAAVDSDYGLSCAKQPYSLRRLRIGRSPLSSYGL